MYPQVRPPEQRQPRSAWGFAQEARPTSAFAQDDSGCYLRR
jgi:hypothetical protein